MWGQKKYKNEYIKVIAKYKQFKSEKGSWKVKKFNFSESLKTVAGTCYIFIAGILY